MQQDMQLLYNQRTWATHVVSNKYTHIETFINKRSFPYNKCFFVNFQTCAPIVNFYIQMYLV